MITETPALTFLAWVVAALILSGLQLAIVAQHPEPDADEPDAAIKPRYATLVRPSSCLIVAVLTVVGCLPLLGMPGFQRPVWVVWASAALVLVLVDARTTWLPIRATWLTAICLAVAVGAGAALADETNPRPIVGALLGAAAAAAIFAAFWWLSRSLGFGDVRLAALTGGLAGSISLEMWYLSLLAGTLAAACWGLVTTWWRRTHPSPFGTAFPYGPGLWLGPYLAWVWLTVAG